MKPRGTGNIAGQKFGRLQVLYKTDFRGKKGQVLWRCQCDCGQFTLTPYGQLAYGATKSCGCLWRDVMIKHGRSRTLPYRMWLSAKSRAKHKNVPFSIVVDDILIPETCPLLGTKLKWTGVKGNPYSPVLDRIIPKLGYVKSNIWVISARANFLKSNASLEELYSIADNLRIKMWLDREAA